MHFFIMLKYILKYKPHALLYTYLTDVFLRRTWACPVLNKKK